MGTVVLRLATRGTGVKFFLKKQSVTSFSGSFTDFLSLCSCSIDIMKIMKISPLILQTGHKPDGNNIRESFHGNNLKETEK